MSLNDFIINNDIRREDDSDYDEFKLYKLICRRGGYQVNITSYRRSPTGRNGSQLPKNSMRRITKRSKPTI